MNYFIREKANEKSCNIKIGKAQQYFSHLSELSVNLSLFCITLNKNCRSANALNFAKQNAFIYICAPKYEFLLKPGWRNW